MNSTIRTLSSAIIGVGLLVGVPLSAFLTGIESDTTVIAISALTIFGLIEMAILSYAPSPRRGLMPRETMVTSAVVPVSYRTATPSRVANRRVARPQRVLAAH